MLCILPHNIPFRRCHHAMLRRDKRIARCSVDRFRQGYPADFSSALLRVATRKKSKVKLRLDIRSEAFRGGESYGPSIVPGNAAESPLMH